MKVALCSMCKLENNYIREWVEYYIHIGVDKIFLYDHNDIDGEYLKEPILDYVEQGIVEVNEDYRGVLCGHITTFTDCYKKHGKEFDWIGFFDIDEFFTLTSESKLLNITNIKQYLSWDIFNDFDIIQLNWLCYGDNDLEEFDKSKGVLERFTKPLNIDFTVLTNHIDPNGYHMQYNMHTKCICRGNRDITFDGDAHCPINNPKLKYCSASGVPHEGMHMTVIPLDLNNYKYAFIRHFFSKTIDEILYKRNEQSSPEKCKVLNKKDKIINLIHYLLYDYIYINKLTVNKIDKIEKYILKYLEDE